jgi:hypothetical protein
MYQGRRQINAEFGNTLNLSTMIPFTVTNAMNDSLIDGTGTYPATAGIKT